MPASIEIFVESEKIYVGEKFHVRVEVRDGMDACTGVGIQSFKLKFEDTEIECIDHEPHETSPGKYEQCIRGLLPGNLKITASVNEGKKTEKVVKLANVLNPEDLKFKVEKAGIEGPDKVHHMNVTASLDNNWSFRGFKKCVSHVWDGKSVDLSTYLSGYDANKKHNDSWKGVIRQLDWNATSPLDKTAADRLISSSLGLVQPKEPNSVIYYYITLSHKGKLLDRLIFTVIPRSTLENFNKWFKVKGSEKGLEWIQKLPDAPNNLVVKNSKPMVLGKFAKDWPTAPSLLVNY